MEDYEYQSAVNEKQIIYHIFRNDAYLEMMQGFTCTWLIAFNLGLGFDN